MQTVDIHVHLLSSEVAFNRFYDKLAIRLFASKLGIRPKELLQDPYRAYCHTLINLVNKSEYLQKIVLFGVDAKVDDTGKVMGRDATVCATNEDLLRLYQQHSDRIIPFFSINPKRDDALDLIDKYCDLGFKGAKFLQNYWGVDTREDRYRDYFEKLKQKKIPLLIHLGSESSVSSVKSCEQIAMLDHPVSVGVTVVAAHMGLSYQWYRPLKAFSRKTKHFNQDYFSLLSMLQRHDNLYADTSALLTPVRAKVLRHLSRQKEVHSKLLFGTDYPVPFTILFNSYDLSLKKRFALAKETNPFDRYVMAMLDYFPKDSPLYSNYKKIFNC